MTMPKLTMAHLVALASVPTSAADEPVYGQHDLVLNHLALGSRNPTVPFPRPRKSRPTAAQKKRKIGRKAARFRF